MHQINPNDTPAMREWKILSNALNVVAQERTALAIEQAKIAGATDCQIEAALKRT